MTTKEIEKEGDGSFLQLKQLELAINIHGNRTSKAK